MERDYRFLDEGKRGEHWSSGIQADALVSALDSETLGKSSLGIMEE